MSITNVFKYGWKLGGKFSRQQKNSLLSLSLLKSAKTIDLSSDPHDRGSAICKIYSLNDRGKSRAVVFKDEGEKS